MTLDDSSNQHCKHSVDSIYSNVSGQVNGNSISKSLSTNSQKIVESNSNEYLSMYVRLLTTTTLLLTNYTTLHTLTQTKIGSELDE